MSRRRNNKKNYTIKILIYIVEKNESESDNKKKIIKQIGKFAVSLITVAASIATCFTLWEMRKERNQSYKPYFVIEPVEYVDEYTKPFFGIQDVKNLSQSLDVDIEKRPQINIVFNNLGAGTATNIDITFSDKVYEEYWGIACQYYDDDKIFIYEDKINYSLYNDDSVVKSSHYMKRNDLNIYKSYVVPGATIEIPLPEEYRTLIRSIAYCTFGDYNELPAIDLTIDYQDLQGIHYKETYRLSIDIEVDLDSSETLDYAKYIIEQCK